MKFTCIRSPRKLGSQDSESCVLATRSALVQLHYTIGPTKSKIKMFRVPDIVYRKVY